MHSIKNRLLLKGHKNMQTILIIGATSGIGTPPEEIPDYDGWLE